MLFFGKVMYQNIQERNAQKEQQIGAGKVLCNRCKRNHGLKKRFYSEWTIAGYPKYAINNYFVKTLPQKTT